MRRQFAVGGYWNFINTNGAGFSCMEIRNSQVGSQTIIQVQRIGNDLVAFTSTGDEAYRVKNAVTPGTFHKYEFRGQVNSADAAGVAQNDGSLEIRIDKQVYKNGDDVATFDPNAPVDPCAKGQVAIPWLATGFAGLGSWDKVMIGPQGDFDCLYIKDFDAYCNDVSPASGAGGVSPGAKTCPPPGPGGSSFDGRAQGSRIVQPGGVPFGTPWFDHDKVMRGVFEPEPWPT